MSCKSNSWKTLVAISCVATFFTLVTFASLILTVQPAHANKKSPVKAKSQSAELQSQKPQVLFDYYPAPLSVNFKDSEYVFVAIDKDGSAQAVRYGPYNPAIIAVYEGKLPESEVASLVAGIQSAVPKASEISKNISCDAEQFQFSLIGPKTQSSMPDPSCLMRMPEEIIRLVHEMRTIWKRLKESKLAHGYVRSFLFAKNVSKSPQYKLDQLISMKKLSEKLRVIVRNVNKLSPRFYPVNQTQFEELKALASGRSDYLVLDSDSGYSLTFFLSRNTSPRQPPKE